MEGKEKTVRCLMLRRSLEMTALSEWRSRMGLSQRAAAEALGVSFATYQSWEHEKRARDGSYLAPPLTALLAAAALEAGMEPVKASKSEGLL